MDKTYTEIVLEEGEEPTVMLACLEQLKRIADALELLSGSKLDLSGLKLCPTAEGDTAVVGVIPNPDAK